MGEAFLFRKVVGETRPRRRLCLWNCFLFFLRDPRPRCLLLLTDSGPVSHSHSSHNESRRPVLHIYSSPGALPAVFILKSFACPPGRKVCVHLFIYMGFFSEKVEGKGEGRGVREKHVSFIGCLPQALRGGGEAGRGVGGAGIRPAAQVRALTGKRPPDPLACRRML